MFREDNLQKLLQKLQENVKEDVIIVPQTMPVKKEADVETPDDMEDIEKEDLTKLDITKKKDREDVVKEVPDKDLEIKPQERKATESLYLCNGCFKTFESKTSKCTLCESEDVELISEERVEPSLLKNVYRVKYELNGEKKETSVVDFDEDEARKHVERLYQGAKVLSMEKMKEGCSKSKHGKKIKEEELTSEVECSKCGELFDACGEETLCPHCELDSIAPDVEEGIEPKDKDSEEVKIKKMTEAVRELIAETPDLSEDDQIILRWALDTGHIDDQFPDTETISDGLAAAEEAGQIPHARVTDLADIHALYLKQVLLPKAEEAWAAKKSKVEKVDEEAEPDKFSVVANDISDKETADALAEEKGGMVVADEDNAEKFAVIVKEVKEDNDSRYDIEKNLRSRIIAMFDKEGFAMTGEQAAATGTHYEFTEGDTMVKVFLEDKNSEDLA
jgi:hypothetical protein